MFHWTAWVIVALALGQSISTCVQSPCKSCVYSYSPFHLHTIAVWDSAVLLYVVIGWTFEYVRIHVGVHVYVHIFMNKEVHGIDPISNWVTSVTSESKQRKWYSDCRNGHSQITLYWSVANRVPIRHFGLVQLFNKIYIFNRPNYAEKKLYFMGEYTKTITFACKRELNAEWITRAIRVSLDFD